MNISNDEIKDSKTVNNLVELFDYFNHKLSERFWGIVQVKFKDGIPFLIEENRQIKLGNSDNKK